MSAIRTSDSSAGSAAVPIRPRCCKGCRVDIPSERPPQTRYCSTECQLRSRTSDQRARSQSAWLARRKVPERHRLAGRRCAHCRKSFRPKKRSTAEYCTSVCSRAAWQKRRQAERRTQLCAERPCAFCGVPFKPIRYTARTCSDRCAVRIWHRAHPDRESQYVQSRRARILGNGTREVVNPERVFQRDGWRCGICRQPTPRELIGSRSPHRPTLDHVVPLSRGGSHTYANVQCACARCNFVKGSRLQEEIQTAI